MPAQRFFIALLLSLFALSAFALDRPFPQNAKRGVMSPDLYPQIVIDGKLRVMTAGGVIRNQDNLIQMPATIAAGEYQVLYTETVVGEIVNVWILTPLEVALRPK